MWIFVLAHAVGYWISEQLNNFTVNRLIKATPLLPGYEFLHYETVELRRIRSRRRICMFNSHLWEMERYVGSVPPTYELKCVRCFPHKHSRRVIKSYNLFQHMKEGAN